MSIKELKHNIKCWFLRKRLMLAFYILGDEYQKSFVITWLLALADYQKEKDLHFTDYETYNIDITIKELEDVKS